jgi:hypothetical protein
VFLILVTLALESLVLGQVVLLNVVMVSKAALNNAIMEIKKVVQQTVSLMLVSPVLDLLDPFQFAQSNVVMDILGDT